MPETLAFVIPWYGPGVAGGAEAEGRAPAGGPARRGPGGGGPGAARGPGRPGPAGRDPHPLRPRPRLAGGRRLPRGARRDRRAPRGAGPGAAAGPRAAP